MEEVNMKHEPAVEKADKLITALMVEPGCYPRQVEIGADLASLQKAVGGDIEALYPYRDQVALVVNESGKLEGLPLNRALRNEDGQIYDAVAGPILVVGLGEEDFTSLSPEQMEKFEKLFHQPEAFLRVSRKLMVIPIPDESMPVKNHLKETPDKGTRSAKPLNNEAR